MPETITVPASVELAVVERSGFVESRHAGSAIVLDAEGYQAEFCADGSGALERFRETRPDLVLLDLMLPGIDGIQVCRQIREESDVPIIMLTARTDTTDVVAGLEAGAKRKDA